uniref:Arginine biosynthesis bifunctional protein ArgJ n=1 Tax=uncultured Thiotrichaceae bacterium TaxID=298394 RepID=A0A6S6TQK7_9GAMM|nr:MAG: Glutamate N-acetyltransferase (EC / N-acetylglutamate synthase (EC [uncultured Thiotrichaceae bacterium]
MVVNLFSPEKLLPVAGVRLSAVSAGIRYQGRDDLVLMELAEGSQCAAVFTKNAFCAAPVIVARKNMAVTLPRYLLINSGNANAGTGDQGLQTAKATCDEVAKLMSCSSESVLPFSTGVIGEQLPLECFQNALPGSVEALAADNWAQAAAGIMTTDTVAKAISRQVELDGGLVTITGMSKGSGMIHPNMATMLAYVATDAVVEQDVLQSLLSEVTDETFNCITVDGDTSTNDALILAATGRSGVQVAASNNLVVFKRAVQEVCLYLAQAIVRDGEGATKFISIDVEGAASRDEARAIGETVALSPLVKTAMFASDPNWGRILAAIGRSPVNGLDVSQVAVWLGGVLLVENGQPAASYTEEQGQQVMQQDEITVRIALGRGDVSASTWTCDFSYDYVKINAEYRS